MPMGVHPLLNGLELSRGCSVMSRRSSSFCFLIKECQMEDAIQVIWGRTLKSFQNYVFEVEKHNEHLIAI